MFMTARARWSGSRIANLIEMQRSGSTGELREPIPDASPIRDASRSSSDSLDKNYSLDWLIHPDHHQFVDNAYRILLGRPPASREYEDTLRALVNGEAKTWLLGTLRYSREGQARGIAVPGLWHRYLAQRLFHLPGIGAILEWLHALFHLRRSLHTFNAADQVAAGNLLDVDQTVRSLAVDRAPDFDRNERTSQADGAATADLQRLHEILQAHMEELEGQLALMTVHVDALRSRIDAFHRADLPETFEVTAPSLLATARERVDMPNDAAVSELSHHARYALFEAVFYDTAVVSAKQRIYLPYVNRELTSRHPFLDIGCGRGEFLRILAGDGIRAIGVDMNPVGLASLRTAGLEVVEQNLLAFLAADPRTFAGASALQVAEHLSADEIERMLSLLAARLAPGAVLVVETPNPLSPFALSHFYTDPTHIAPIPPERLRFSIEAAGFEATRTLFQAKIPAQFPMGPDPRAYYMDYAIIAYRSAS
jgi:SAM-dependent methyltransferase